MRISQIHVDWLNVQNASGFRHKGVRYSGMRQFVLFVRLSKAVQDPPMSAVEACKRHVPAYSACQLVLVGLEARC
jgi:hypothetical protein